jgi:hypothetical protein
MESAKRGKASNRGEGGQPEQRNKKALQREAGTGQFWRHGLLEQLPLWDSEKIRLDLLDFINVQ